ncbi:MAG: dihydropteroate synthase [Armatimonadetes bacterium]|nr:dihydropteroate synthase [Armatimonadota bacterium]
MLHNARVLCLSSDADIIREMQLVNVESGGVRHMLPKSRQYMVKLCAVRRPIVHILKEAFLANGGDAAISRDVITAKIAQSDVILIGTRKQFDGVMNNLLEQGFGCKELQVVIDNAIKNFEGIPAVPAPSAHIDTKLTAMFDLIGKKTLIMGVLNVTPDSFSDGGKFLDAQIAVEHALEMVNAGADIIDIGGESSRPGAEPVSSKEEMSRVLPVIRELASAISAPISIDTYKSEVAEAALDNGALIVNDISAGSFDPAMADLVAKRRCPAILMHMRGTPQDMQADTDYEDVMGEISGFLRSRLRVFIDAGADEKMLIIDPGIGFAKNTEQNLEILRRLRELKSIGRPLLVGASRKSTIGKVLGDVPPEERLEGTAATVAIAIANGADIVRVHDVKEMARTAKMSDAIVRK